jgi:hypothetical protein
VSLLVLESITLYFVTSSYDVGSTRTSRVFSENGGFAI